MEAIETLIGSRMIVAEGTIMTCRRTLLMGLLLAGGALAAPAAELREALVASVGAMCRDLGILVVAEGIETEAERATLVELGCDLLQGFLIGMPVPASC